MNVSDSTPGINHKASFLAPSKNSHSQPFINTTSTKRGSFFGTQHITTVEDRRAIARGRNRTSLSSSSTASSSSSSSSSQHRTKLKPHVLRVEFIEPITSSPAASIVDRTYNLEAEIERELLEKDAKFVLHRRQLLDGPKITPAPKVVKKKRKKTVIRKKKLIVPHDEDALRMGLRVLSSQAIQPESPRTFLSPLLSYVANDATYEGKIVVDHARARAHRPSTAGARRSRLYAPSNKRAKESTEQSLMRTIRTLRCQCEMWKEKFRQEAKTRCVVLDLDKKLTKERDNRQLTERRLHTQQAATTNMLKHQLQEATTSEEQANHEAQFFKLQYSSEALFQVNTSLQCQVANCGYRKIALAQKKNVADLKQQIEVLDASVTALIKEANKKVLRAALRPEDQPKAMHSGFAHPLSLASLPAVAAVKRVKGGGKAPVKIWSIKRTLREIAALMSSKLDSDRRCDYAQIPRLSMPTHFRSFYLNHEGTMHGAMSKLATVATAIMKHQEGPEGSSLIKIVAAMLGLTHSTTFNARCSHVMIGLLARLAIGEYGEAAIEAASSNSSSSSSSSTQSSTVSIGGVLRGVLLRCALNGEDTVELSMALFFRMMRFSFPLLSSTSGADRLCLHGKIRENLVTSACELFHVKDVIPFINAVRYETKKALKKQERDFVRLRNIEFAPSPPPPPLPPRTTTTTTKQQSMKDTDDKAHPDSGVKTMEFDIEEHERSKKETELLRRVQEVPDKTKKLLLVVADNATALRNLFAIFDEDGSGGVAPEELRIALSQFGKNLIF